MLTILVLLLKKLPQTGEGRRWEPAKQRKFGNYHIDCFFQLHNEKEYIFLSCKKKHSEQYMNSNTITEFSTTYCESEKGKLWAASNLNDKMTGT